jgi:hypothetical protein
VCVCVCVCVSETGRENVCSYSSECVREIVCVHVYYVG